MGIQRWRRLRRSERGFTLLEVAIAMALLASTVVVMLQVMGDSTRIAARVEESTLQLQLARSQLEVIQQSPFQSNPANYPSISDIPEGWSIQVSVVDTGITYTYPAPDSTTLTNVVQKITVQVTGDFDILTLEGYKVMP